MVQRDETIVDLHIAVGINVQGNYFLLQLVKITQNINTV